MIRLSELYGVSRAGYYAWGKRPLSSHAEQDRRLLRDIQRIFREHRGRYGSPRVHHELLKAGFRVGRRRIARLMRLAGLRGRVARVYRANPRLHGFFTQHPNRLLVTKTQAPDQVWVGDITYLPVARRWWFLAVVMDQHSRRIVAWSLARRRDARLTCSVLNAAIRRRQPAPGLIFHSDRGSEYSAALLRDRLRKLGLEQSSARRGPSENPHMESFFHSLKAELLHGTRFETSAGLRSALRVYITYYNSRRAHSALGFTTPIAYEQTAA